MVSAWTTTNRTTADIETFVNKANPPSSVGPFNYTVDRLMLASYNVTVDRSQTAILIV